MYRRSGLLAPRVRFGHFSPTHFCLFPFTNREEKSNVQLLFAHLMCVGMNTAENDALTRNTSMILGVARSVLLAIVVVHHHPFYEFYQTLQSSLRAAEKMEESISLLEKVLGDTDAHAQEVKERAKVRASPWVAFWSRFGNGGCCKNIPGFEKRRFTFVAMAGVKIHHLCP